MKKIWQKIKAHFSGWPEGKVEEKIQEEKSKSKTTTSKSKKPKGLNPKKKKKKGKKQGNSA